MSKENKSKAGIFALFAKLGSKLISVLGKLFKSIKLIKVGLAAASLAGYAALFSWKFGLLLMIAIGWHESGHVWAMKKMGIKTKGFYFLPFIGGAAMAWASAGLYWLTGNPMWAAAGAWMATLNLFNLLPITPLDGGQLVRSIAFSIHKTIGVIFLAVSLLAGGIIMWKLRIGLFVLILAIGALELFLEVRRRIMLYKVRQGTLSRWKLPHYLLDPDQEDGLKRYPFSMNKKHLALTGLAYAGTIAVLVSLLMLLKDIPGADLAANFLE